MFELILNYVPTRLESAVVAFYRKLDIRSPYDIDLHIFAQDAGIWVHELDKPTTHYEFNDTMYTIVLDRRLPWQQQRIEFAHELGHVLLHAGRQDFMVNDLRALQEWQADRFAMYALAPTFMIANTLTHASSRQQLVRQLAEVFDVHEVFMDVRLKMLEQRLRDLSAQRRIKQVIEDDRSRYDYTYRHPLNNSIEYLVKNNRIVGQRRRAQL